MNINNFEHPNITYYNNGGVLTGGIYSPAGTERRRCQQRGCGLEVDAEDYYGGYCKFCADCETVDIWLCFKYITENGLELDYLRYCIRRMPSRNRNMMDTKLYLRLYCMEDWTSWVDFLNNHGGAKWNMK